MAKPKIKKPPVTFVPAAVVEEIAYHLIQQHHPHLVQHAVRIEYIFRSDTPKTKGKSVRGTMRIVSSLNAFFGRENREAKDQPIKRFFAMVISRPAWDVMDADERQALVDHELCHAYATYDDGGTKLQLLHHDLEEFTAVVLRHGIWKRDMKPFASAVMSACPQQTLDLNEPGRVPTLTLHGSPDEINQQLEEATQRALAGVRK